MSDTFTADRMEDARYFLLEHYRSKLGPTMTMKEVLEVDTFLSNLATVIADHGHQLEPVVFGGSASSGKKRAKKVAFTWETVFHEVDPASDPADTQEGSSGDNSAGSSSEQESPEIKKRKRQPHRGRGKSGFLGANDTRAGRYLEYPEFGTDYPAGRFFLHWPNMPAHPNAPDWHCAVMGLRRASLLCVWQGDWSEPAPQDPPNAQRLTLAQYQQRYRAREAYLEWQEVLGTVLLAFSIDHVRKHSRLLRTGFRPSLFTLARNSVREVRRALHHNLAHLRHLSYERRYMGDERTDNREARAIMMSLKKSDAFGDFREMIDSLMGYIDGLTQMSRDILEKIAAARKPAKYIVNDIQKRREELAIIMERDAILPNPERPVYAAHPGVVMAMMDGLDMVEKAIEQFIKTIDGHKKELKRISNYQLLSPVMPYPQPPSEAEIREIEAEEREVMLARMEIDGEDAMDIPTEIPVGRIEWMVMGWVEPLCEDLEGLVRTHSTYYEALRIQDAAWARTRGKELWGA